MNPQDSVGIVTPQVARFDEPLRLTCGRDLANYELVYETYGELNEEHSNGVLICHALSGNHHAAGYHSAEDKKPGWWDECIGPGKPIDTNHFFVVSLNNLGGCHGSTGPSSINPATESLGGRISPCAAGLGITARPAWRTPWYRLLGGGDRRQPGRMQAMRWSLEYPERVRHCIVIAAA